MGQACRALDFPIVSGNVSLYNESKATGGGSAILPTPAIGGVGLMADWEKSATIAFKAAGEDIYLIGETPHHLGQSLFLKVIHDRADGPPPPVDLDHERRHGEFVRAMIDQGVLTAVHDISDGGLLVAAAEMALAGGIGADLHCERLTARNRTAMLFGEDQARYIVTTTNAQALRDAARLAGVALEPIGTTADDGKLTLDGMDSIALADLSEAHEGFFPALMQGEL